MSHFTVLVPAKDRAELHRKLIPYKEYGWGDDDDGLDPYLVFQVEYSAPEVPEAAAGIARKVLSDDCFTSEPETRAKYAQYLADEDWHAILRDYEGGTADEYGNWGYTYNPNAKWDWYSVGGRWSGLLRLKDFAAALVENSIGRGTPGIFGRMNNHIDRVDFALAGNIDWDGMQQEQIDRKMERYNIYHQAKATGCQPTEDDIEKARDRVAGSKKLQDEFGSGERLATLWAIEREAREIAKVWLDIGEMNLMDVAEDEYKELLTPDALAFAFIDLEGKWNQSGQMGWFACVSNPEPDYDARFWEFIKTIPPELQVYIVDCHI